MHSYSVFQVSGASTFPILWESRQFWVLLSLIFIMKTTEIVKVMHPVEIRLLLLASFETSSLREKKVICLRKVRCRMPRELSKNAYRAALGSPATVEWAATNGWIWRWWSSFPCFTSLFMGYSRTGIQVCWQNDFTYAAEHLPALFEESVTEFLNLHGMNAVVRDFYSRDIFFFQSRSML